MENKINIAEILKDCPKDMELNCFMYEDVYFDYVDELNNIHCYIQQEFNKTSVIFNQDGTPTSHTKSKCVIFPKGKTTWEGFQIPFKDGDIVATSSGTWIGITTGGKSCEFMPTYCVIKGDSKFEAYLDKKGTWQFSRFATEEEKKKLFDAIKENGYKWNAETKTLEKLVDPKFKVGNKVRNKNYKDYIYDIHDITDKGYRAKEINADSPIIILFGSQEDNYELVPNKFDITTLIPFESRVLMRSSNAREWVGTFYSHYSDNKFYGCGMCCDQCIPYERNEHLLGKTDDCDEYFKNW